jgi:hypothetical protein
MLRLTTANLFNYGRYTARPEWRRQQEDQLLGLREIAPDVLCVQEFWHQARDLRQDPDAPELVAAWAEFCQALGMHGRLAPARSHHHVGVLWRADRARLLAWQDYSHWSALHHALGVAILDLGPGGPWRVAAVHL